MIEDLQIAYYFLGAAAVVVAFAKSAYNGIVNRLWSGIKRIEAIESKIDTIQESQQEIQHQQTRMDGRQETLVAAIIAAVKRPESVDPDSIEEALTKDDTTPSPSDFTNGQGVDWEERHS